VAWPSSVTILPLPRVRRSGILPEAAIGFGKFASSPRLRLEKPRVCTFQWLPTSPTRQSSMYAPCFAPKPKKSRSDQFHGPRSVAWTSGGSSLRFKPLPRTAVERPGWRQAQTTGDPRAGASLGPGKRLDPSPRMWAGRRWWFSSVCCAFGSPDIPCKWLLKEELCPNLVDLFGL